MEEKILKKLLILGFGVVAGSAMAQTFGPGPGGLIPDNSATGLTSDIVVSSSDVITSFNWVSITFSTKHTWAGDLIVKLTHVESGKDVHLFSRLGATTHTGLGDSSDLEGTYRFFNTGASFATAAAGVAGGVVIPTGDYARSSHAAGTSFVNSLGIQQFDPDNYTIFNGGALGGTWRLFINDNAGGDTGAISGWSFNVDAVPEPASMAVLGLGAAALLRRRRK